MFRLLKLKPPPHGWNAVAWELAIVTLGVLIALAAQQIVADIHDREAVAQLRSALRAELADDRARWEDMRAQMLHHRGLSRLNAGPRRAGAERLAGLSLILLNMIRAAGTLPRPVRRPHTFRWTSG